MRFDAVGAMQECITWLDLDPSAARTHAVRATICNDRQPSMSGQIEVIFNSNWHCGDGPFLEFGDEIESFGIRFTKFQPKWLDMTWDEKNKKLTIKHKEYKFTLGFGI